jgi:hypothetical protein
MDTNLKEMLEYLIIPVILVVLGYINEKGFENLISKVFVERYLKPLKPFQSYLVVITGIVLAFISRQVGIDLVPNLSPYLTSSGDIVTVFSGVLIAVISMAMHKSTTKLPTG